MKDLKAFMEDLVKDNNLAKKFEDVVDPEQVSKLAKKEGYEFTPKEYEDLAMTAVSGGLSWGDFKKGLGKIVSTAGTAVEGFSNLANSGEKAFNSAKDVWEKS